MVGRFDVETHEINVVSIPRDTLMNITGSTKKINELYLRGVNSDGDGVGRLLDGIRDMIGFEVDVYAVVDLQAFVELVNAIGGVDYDVEYAQQFLRPHKNLRMIVNARAVCESRPLARLMDDALDEVCEKYDLDCQVFFTECFGMADEGR